MFLLFEASLFLVLCFGGGGLPSVGGSLFPLQSTHYPQARIQCLDQSSPVPGPNVSVLGTTYISVAGTSWG